MTLPTPLRRLLRQSVLPLLLVAAVARGADPKFSTPPELSTEAITLVGLLQQGNYNRDQVHSSDYAEVVPDYMEALDPEHLFFLAKDKADFDQRYGGGNVFYNVAYLGNIDPAYSIFSVFLARTEARTRWIQDQLKGKFDFTGDETYAADRTKAPWPANTAEADALWRRKLKFDLLSEMLNRKSLAEAEKIVGQRYDREMSTWKETDGGELAELYLNMITQLYDPHSNYFSADNYDDFGIQMKLELTGIGAMLSLEDDACVVKELVLGGPADLSHQLKPGDRIIAVAQDGQEPIEITGMKLRRIVDLIRGPKGTKVRLTFEPADATDPSQRRQVTIVRDKVKLESARAHAAVFQVPDAKGKTIPIGVITLPSFYRDSDQDSGDKDPISASGDIARLIRELQAAHVQGLVLDLRHNGGGLLPEAINITGLFIPPGPVVQVRDGNGDVQVDSDDLTSALYGGPLAVLVDRFSASASEIVTGALQNYGRAVIVGDSSTHGKGTVQDLIEMRDASPALADSPERTGAAKITIQKFYLPNGSSTQLKGVVPDIVLPSIDDYLPIGESDLRHALIWDRIPSSVFDGAPLSPRVVSILQRDSQARQTRLPEFAFLRENVDWFKAREAEKEFSLNLAERQKEQIDDKAFRKKVESERDALAKNAYPFKEFRLGPAPKPPIKQSSSDPLDDDDEDADAGYDQVDVPLRETLRVLDDAIGLGHDRQYWVDDHAPLTVAGKS